MEREDMEAPDVLAGGATLVGATTTRSVNVAYRTKNTLELAGRIGRKPVQILIDSGSTGNYVAARVCTVCKLKTEKDPHGEELRMADGTTVKIEDRVQVNIKCGKYRALVQAKVFPGLQKPMILGIPWLAKENPQIDWTQGTILAQQTGAWMSLPLIRRKTEDTANEISLISAKQMSRLLKMKEVDHAFVAFIRLADEEDVQVESSDVEQSGKWRSDLPDTVKAVLKDYDDVFPDDLPPGLPPKRQGYEFKIELEDNVPPVHRPLYKLSPMELDEAKKQI